MERFWDKIMLLVQARSEWMKMNKNYTKWKNARLDKTFIYTPFSTLCSEVSIVVIEELLLLLLFSVH